MEDINKKMERLDSWNLEKRELSVDWNQNIDRERRRYIKQGEIYTCVVGENIGSEIRGHEKEGEDIAHVRPVLIVSDTRYNNNALVTVIPLTSTVRIEENPEVEGRESPKIKNHYILKKSNYSFLRNDSTVAPNQIKTVSSIRLKHFLGYVNETDMAGIKNRLQSFFGLKG